MNKIRLLVAAVVLLVLGILIFLILHFRNQLPFPVLRSDIAKGNLVVAPMSTSPVQEVVNKYEYDKQADSGVMAFPTESGSVVVIGQLKSSDITAPTYPIFDIVVGTLSGDVTVTITEDTVYSSTKDKFTSFSDSGLKELQSLREISLGSKVHVKAKVDAEGKLFAEYVEERRAS